MDKNGQTLSSLYQNLLSDASGNDNDDEYQSCIKQARENGYNFEFWATGRQMFAYVVKLQDHPTIMTNVRLPLPTDKELAIREIKRIQVLTQRMRSVKHQHLERVLDGYTDPNGRSQSILKEPIINNTLAKLLNAPGLSYLDDSAIPYQKHIKKWFLCLSSAVEFLHGQEISHGNIQPRSIYYRKSHIILADFNFDPTRYMRSNTLHVYSVPSALSSDYNNFPAASTRDIFSLGLVFVEMLTCYLGEKIRRMREFLHGDAWEYEPYYERLDRLSRWFASCHGISPRMVNAKSLYDGCFVYMLNPPPGMRLTASNVLDHFLKEGDFLSHDDIICDCIRYTSRQDHYPETGWQLDREKFLWNGSAHTPLDVTSRGMLGRGRNGEVDEVTVPGFDITIARKKLFIPRINAPGALEKRGIRTEVENLKRLSHKHIVSALGCYLEHSGKYSANFYLLLYPAGDSDLRIFLEEICKDASPENKATYSSWIRMWFNCLTSALAYLHYHGIHHEDIKPANIIHRGDSVYFTDFSSSRKIRSHDDTSTESPAAATRLYAAPEALYQGQSISRHGSGTDVYSLGLVFVEMLTVMVGKKVDDLREFVFGDTEDQRQYHRVVDKFSHWFPVPKDPAYWIYTPKLLYDLFLNFMLVHERKKRYSAQAMADVLAKYAKFHRITTCGCYFYRWDRDKMDQNEAGPEDEIKGDGLFEH